MKNCKRISVFGLKTPWLQLYQSHSNNKSYKAEAFSVPKRVENLVVNKSVNQLVLQPIRTLNFKINLFLNSFFLTSKY
tara:strand:+ start:321 stop:554 length:234 start_codon:yes stop_codon:yes gene_type:complete